MSFDKIGQPIEPAIRLRIEIIFEFNVPNPKPTFYRAVRATDGSFRMEKRGQSAKAFRAIMWCGSIEGLFRFREAAEYNYKK